MSAPTDPVIIALEAAARSEAASICVTDVLERVKRELTASDRPMAWESIPLAVFDRRLPEAITSCWVFVLRACAETGAERHRYQVER